MNGTIFSVTAPMRLMPPMMTKPARTISTAPVTTAGMPKAVRMLEAIVLTWLILPMPKAAMVQKMLNRTARILPIVLQPFFAPRPSER